uniref:Uncharacterized protein n=1 Tax=Tanacetum cinerariifolium TaxID=118510 RepID=A0A6L2K130_TANCI|nr:hypothetical protein [Tanacetum cinerariifolium]
MDDDLFASKLKVLEDFFPCVEQTYDNLKNGDLDIYEPRQCYDEYERMFAEAIILIDNRFVKLIDITLEQWLDLKFGDHKNVDKEIMEGGWYMEKGDDEGILTYDKFFDLEEENLRKKEEEESREDAWSNYLPNDDNDAIQANHEWFDDHEPIKDDDDDIGELDDYFIQNDEPYNVDEEEERFKERRSKLLGIPYKKPAIYGHLEEIVVKRSDQQLYKFKEGDFVDLNLNDIEDMLLLAVQHKLFHLDGSDIVDFIVAIHEEKLAFLTDPAIPDGQATQITIPNTGAFQTDDLDAYDSDCDDVSNVMDAPTNHVPAEENLRDPIEIRVDIFHPTLVMAAPTNHVPAEENLRDPIEIRVDIFHPTLVAVVDFPTATVMRTLARHANVIRSI